MADQVLLLLCVVAFTAGFVDAIVGGGGLIQTPMALLLLPDYAVSVVIGTLKIPAFSGTEMSIRRRGMEISPLLARHDRPSGKFLSRWPFVNDIFRICDVVHMSIPRRCVTLASISRGLTGRGYGACIIYLPGHK